MSWDFMICRIVGCVNEIIIGEPKDTSEMSYTATTEAKKYPGSSCD
jgi:hypothetical protein